MTGTRSEGNWIMVLMAVLGLVFLGLDIRDFVMGTVNVVQHVPFLYSAGCIAAIFSILVVESSPVAPNAIDPED